jgi:hypothetical protein
MTYDVAKTAFFINILQYTYFSYITNCYEPWGYLKIVYIVRPILEYEIRRRLKISFIFSNFVTIELKGGTIFYFTEFQVSPLNYFQVASANISVNIVERTV